MPMRRIAVLGYASRTESHERAQRIRQKLSPGLAERTLCGWNSKLRLQGMIEECVEFRLQASTRRI